MATTKATPQDFATFLVEFIRIPWAEVKATARQNAEQKEQFTGWVTHVTSADDFLFAFCKDSGRTVSMSDVLRFAPEVAELILAVK